MKTSNQPTLREAIADYTATRRGDYAAGTWDAHRLRLANVAGWLYAETQPNVYLSDIADPDTRYMERYFNKIRPPRLAPASFNKARQYVGAFWQYCSGRSWIQTNPMLFVRALPVAAQVRLRLSPAELLECLEGAEPRDRIGLALGMNTALRSADIMGLKVGAANLTNLTLTAYLQKTRKVMEMPITSELADELLRWFESYAQTMKVEGGAQALPNHWTLVPPMRYLSANPLRRELGGSITYKTFGKMTMAEQIVHRALERLGHPTAREGFHTLRRSSGRALYDMLSDDGVPNPIKIVQAFYDHKHQQQTEDYLGMSAESAARDKLLRGQSFLNRAAKPAAVHSAPTSLDDRRRSA